MKKFLVSVGILFCLLFCFWMISRSRTINDTRATRAIVGEAANQNDSTMVCVAHGIRNRGTLIGVYGFLASHIWHEPASIWHRAAVAWAISGQEKIDPVHGAKNWGTEDDLNKLGIDGTEVKAKCGDIYFY